MFQTKSWWRRIFAVVAVGILAFTAAPATAASADWEYGLIKSGLPPEWCLSTNRTAYPGFPTNTAAVYTTTCDARKDFHLWAVADISGSNPWSISNKGNHSCLSMNLQQAPGGNANTRAVYTVGCNGSIYQLWYWGADSQIRNYATGWCLSTNLTPHPGSPDSTHAVYATNCSTTAAHLWGYLPA